MYSASANISAVCRVAIVFAAALVLALVGAEKSSARLYWSSLGVGPGYGGTTIGVANSDGTGVNPAFVAGIASPCGVAVDGQYIYWIGSGNNDIGRARLDGTEVNHAFIVRPDNGSCGIAVDDNYIYWATGGPGTTIGRANKDGSLPNNDFITGTSQPCGLAVNGSHIYWARTGSIARSNLDGTNVVQSFISNPTGACMIALNDTHVFWGGNNNNVGRANLDGGDPNPNFISGLPGYACGVAVDSNYVYWNTTPAGKIGRANLDGSGVNVDFITGLVPPCGLAVGKPLLATPVIPSLTFVSAKNTKRGALSLVVDVNLPGTVKVTEVRKRVRKKGSRKRVLAKPLARSKSVTAAAAGRLTIPIAPTKRAKKSIKLGKRVKVKLRLTFTPTVGNPVVIDQTVSFKAAKKKRKR